MKAKLIQQVAVASHWQIDTCHPDTDVFEHIKDTSPHLVVVEWSSKPLAKHIIDHVLEHQPQSCLLVFAFSNQPQLKDLKAQHPALMVLATPDTRTLSMAIENAVHAQFPEFPLQSGRLRLPDPSSAAVQEPPQDPMFFKRPARPDPAPKPEATPAPVATEVQAPLEAPQTSPATPEREAYNMSSINETLNAALSTIDGATAAALVEYNSGMMLGSAGGGVNLELAAAGNTDVVKAKMRTMQSLGISGSIEDILITLDSQYHIIYLVPGQTLFLYLVLQKDRANLALARYKLKALGAELKV